MSGARSRPAAGWEPVDVASIVDGIESGDIVGPIPTLLTRSDGVALLYPGEVNSLQGEPETGKGWIVAAASKSLIESGKRVLYLDFEDTAASVVGRLLALGAARDAIAEHFTYIRPEAKPTPEIVDGLHAGGTFALDVIDGLSEAYLLCGLDPNDNADAARFLATLPRPLAERGAAVVEIDHVTKDRETRGRYAIGAQHKLAGIACAYSVEASRPPTRLTAGMLKIKVTKDRHGHVRGHADSNGTIALIHITPANDGKQVTVVISPPDATADDGTFRPTAIMERVSRFLDSEPGATSNTIRRDVDGKHKDIDQAVRVLISERYVEVRPKGQAHHHHNVSAYRQDADPARTAPPRPNHVPTASQNGASNRAPASHPLKGGHGTRNETGELTIADRVRLIAALPTETEQERAWEQLNAEQHEEGNWNGWTDDDLEAIAAEIEEAA